MKDTLCDIHPYRYYFIIEKQIEGEMSFSMRRLSNVADAILKNENYNKYQET